MISKHLFIFHIFTSKQKLILYFCHLLILLLSESGPGVSSVSLEAGMELLSEYKLKIGKLMKEKAELINAQNLFNIGTYVHISAYIEAYIDVCNFCICVI